MERDRHHTKVFRPTSDELAEKFSRLIQTLRRRHGCFDVQAANVLPSLLQKRDEVVDCQHDVGDQLILSHAHVSDRDTHAENFFQLELDGRLHFVDLGGQILIVRDGCWELTGCEESSVLVYKT